ncbi:MAG: dihydrodipicolinate synthase family protein [Eubacteriales bacterium]|nr:dihydrodipicolinate synthase family protein [Eubacteriales bacterium]
MAKIIVPVVTVFDRTGKPDREGNQKVADYLIANHVDGILVLGSAGEFTELTATEKQRFLSDYADHVAGRTALYAGTGDINFQQTLALSNSVYAMGYRAPLIVGPYYYGTNQAQLLAYFDALAQSLKGDMYIYNYPARTGCSIAADTLRELVTRDPNIVGLKDTVSEPGHTNQICRAMEGRPFAVYSGYDDQFLYNLAVGGSGSIGGLANVVPDIWSDLIRSANANDMARTVALARLLSRLMPIYEQRCSSSILFKKLMIHRGLAISPQSIFPFDGPDDGAFETMRGLLDQVLADYRQLGSATA